MTRAAVLAAALALGLSPAMAKDAPSGSATIGSGGSAAAGGTSASTVGTGGYSSGPSGTSTSIGSGGSAATTEGRATTSTKINENPNKLQGMSKARAQDGGTWSSSKTKTKVGKDGELSSRTKSMAHEPGGPPTKSTTRTGTSVSQ